MSPQLITLYVAAAAAAAAVRRRATAGGRDRGDVPGWVMITVMSAALVLAILIPFREAIVDAVQEALDSVTNAPAQ
ncbi:MAG: hypothetical protein H0V64_13365 [Geodermatophilaceae bacterium]|nr:hypothetical protein [Geodermatophilaceae bacterium]MDQ3466253.1 hypothetical protein [Actinomycetota bacterium]